jgi:hypothetical protein
MREKTMKMSQREERSRLMVLMIRVARWRGPDIKTPSNENGSKVENGPYCPVNVETDHLT